jgi:hypothetical protein
MVSVDGRPVAEKLNVPLPPVADTDAVYAKPTVPLGRGEVVVIVTWGAIVNVNCLEAGLDG